MIESHKLFLDTDCPMCKLYGNCFVNLKWIDRHTLTSYQNSITQYAETINVHKARNKIALHNEINGQTIYGIEAFIKIFSENNRFFNWVFNFTFIQWMLCKLYSFISYNRKVIYPVATENIANPCIPDFKLRHRNVYIIMVAFLTGLILNQFTFNLNKTLGIPHTWWLEYLVCFGQILWQGSVAYLITKNKTIEYLGNMSTVSLIGGILLVPFLIINQFFVFSPVMMLTYFGLIVGIILAEHIRRCKLLNLSLWMTCSWIIYRIIVLIIIVSVIIIQTNKYA